MIAAAGRSRLLELRRELASARDGRGLLDRKREAILREIAERSPRLATLAASVECAISAARAQLVDAQCNLGRVAVDSAALAQPVIDDIVVGEDTVVGTALPRLHAAPRTFVPLYGPSSGSPALDRAAAAFAALVPDLLALASQQSAVRRLRRALARTVRRLNALDTLVIPELSKELRVVSAALEEEERDEAVRRERYRAGATS